MEKELLRQLEELEKRAKKMAGRSTGQTFSTWKSIETKAKELQSLLKAVQEGGWDGCSRNLLFFCMFVNLKLPLKSDFIRHKTNNQRTSYARVNFYVVSDVIVKRDYEKP